MANVAFEIGSIIAVVGWFCLIVAVLLAFKPVHKTMLWLGGRVIPIGLSALYLVLVILYWGSAPDGDYSSLTGVSNLFQSDGNLAAGWIHFLAFDLFIGHWMIKETLASNQSKITLLICLPVTFLYGPIGLLLYFVIGKLSKFSVNGKSTTAELHH